MTYFASTISHIEKDETCEFLMWWEESLWVTISAVVGWEEGIGPSKTDCHLPTKILPWKFGTHRWKKSGN